MKEIDTTKAKNVPSYSLLKVFTLFFSLRLTCLQSKLSPKQTFIEFLVERSDSRGEHHPVGSGGDAEFKEEEELNYSNLTENETEDDSQKNQEDQYIIRTKIMLVTTNSVKEESYFSGLASIDSLIDLIMTDDKPSVIKKDRAMAGKPISDNVIKHFILTTAPTQQNHKATLNTISLGSRIDLLTKAREPVRTTIESRSGSRSHASIKKHLTNLPENFRRSVSPHSQTLVGLSSPPEKNFDKLSEQEISSSNNIGDRSGNTERVRLSLYNRRLTCT